ncbi:MAG TPA: hypothetical protein PKK06_09760 [Phycisphaerae bacterium]|nr:hypothetical protein [Phycisphaerae bacterium]HNU45586.1 hypothetical protein [Phycisphaerae bacterium]
MEGTNGTAWAEAKGLAAPVVRADGQGTSRMNRVPERLVQRIQHDLRPPSNEGARPVAPELVEQLHNRLRRLHGLGEAFTAVRLSSYVAG